MLNAILDEKVTKVRLDCDKILERDLRDDKLGILDIRAKLNGKIDCDIEMQMADQKNIEKRIIYYISKMYSQNLKKTENYSKLTKCIGILFVNYDLDKLKKVEKYITKWNLRENNYRKIVLTDVIELYIIEISKVHKYAKNSKLDVWVKFINNSEDVNMEEVDEEIKEAQKVLKEINQDEHERYLADLREKYIYDMNTIKSEGFEDGLKQGIQHEKAKIAEIAKKLKEQGIAIEIIIKTTGLTKEEIEKL